jgi:hypothetical protein
VTRAIAILAMVLGMISPTLATEFFGGRTALFQSAEAGTAVIYFEKRGSDAYLWYPGSDTVLKGKMQVLGSGTLPDELCLTFGKQRYSPISGLEGGRGRCAKMGVVTSGVVEQAAGDIFGLATCPTAPASFGAGATSLRKLAARAGVRLTTAIDLDALVIRPGGKMTKAKADKLKAMAEGKYVYTEPDTSGIVPPPCH